MDWSEVLRENSRSLLLYARQWTNCLADAEDAVQDGFVRVWKNEKARSLPRKRIVPYLFKAVKTAALDRHRSNKRRRVREEKVHEDVSATVALFEYPNEPDERVRMIEKAMWDLPKEQREVLVLKLWGDMTFRSIGEMLGITTSTAASRYRYALESIRKKVNA